MLTHLRILTILSLSILHLPAFAMNQLTRTAFKKAITQQTQLLHRILPHQHVRYEGYSKGPCEDFCNDSLTSEQLTKAQSAVRNLKNEIDNENHRIENYDLNADLMAAATHAGAMGAGLLSFYLQLPLDDALLTMAEGGMVGAGGYALNHCVVLNRKYKRITTLSTKLSEAQKTVAELSNEN